MLTTAAGAGNGPSWTSWEGRVGGLHRGLGSNHLFPSLLLGLADALFGWEQNLSISSCTAQVTPARVGASAAQPRSTDGRAEPRAALLPAAGFV